MHEIPTLIRHKLRLQHQIKIKLLPVFFQGALPVSIIEDDFALLGPVNEFVPLLCIHVLSIITKFGVPTPYQLSMLPRSRTTLPRTVIPLLSPPNQPHLRLILHSYTGPLLCPSRPFLGCHPILRILLALPLPVVIFLLELLNPPLALHRQLASLQLLAPLSPLDPETISPNLRALLSHFVPARIPSFFIGLPILVPELAPLIFALALSSIELCGAAIDFHLRGISFSERALFQELGALVRYR